MTKLFKNRLFYAQSEILPTIKFFNENLACYQNSMLKQFYSKIQQKSAVVDNSEIQTNTYIITNRPTCYIDNFNCDEKFYFRSSIVRFAKPGFLSF